MDAKSCQSCGAVWATEDGHRKGCVAYARKFLDDWFSGSLIEPLPESRMLVAALYEIVSFEGSAAGDGFNVSILQNIARHALGLPE